MEPGVEGGGGGVVRAYGGGRLNEQWLLHIDALRQPMFRQPLFAHGLGQMWDTWPLRSERCIAI